MTRISIHSTDVKIISIEFASKEENHMQFFGQVIVNVSAIQEERAASAKGTIVIPFPSGTDPVGKINGISAAADVSVDVELPVMWTDDGKAVCHVTFELNEEEIAIHHPVETWHSGRHILSLYYPIEKLVPNITNTFNVYLRMENGTGTVETGGCIASISGQAMAAAAAWDGKINIEEAAALFVIGGGLKVRTLNETIKIETMELVLKSYADHVPGRTAIGAFGRPIELEGF